MGFLPATPGLPWLPVLPRTYHGSDSQCTLPQSTSTEVGKQAWRAPTEAATLPTGKRSGIARSHWPYSSGHSPPIQVSRENKATWMRLAKRSRSGESDLPRIRAIKAATLWINQTPRPRRARNVAAREDNAKSTIDCSNWAITVCPGKKALYVCSVISATNASRWGSALPNQKEASCALSRYVLGCVTRSTNRGHDDGKTSTSRRGFKRSAARTRAV